MNISIFYNTIIPIPKTVIIIIFTQLVRQSRDLIAIPSRKNTISYTIITLIEHSKLNETKPLNRLGFRGIILYFISFIQASVRNAI